jgi:hypothetical protein
LDEVRAGHQGHAFGVQSSTPEGGERPFGFGAVLAATPPRWRPLMATANGP